MAKTTGKTPEGAVKKAAAGQKAKSLKTSAKAAPKTGERKAMPAEKPATEPAAKSAAPAKASPVRASKPKTVKAPPKPVAEKEPASAKPGTAAKAKASKTAAKAAPKAGERKAAPAEKPSRSPAAKSAASAKASPVRASKPKTIKAPPKPVANKPAAEKAAAAAKVKPAKSTKSGGHRRSHKKPWLKFYPANMAAEIAPLTASSIGDMLIEASKQYAGRPAFTCMGKTISFAELERLSTAFGAFLQSKGLAKGARVALMMPNVLPYPIAMLGILRAGYTVVNVNPLYMPRELEHQLKDSGAEAIVILENFAHTLQAIAGKTPVKHVVVATMGDMLGLKGHLVNLVVRRVKKLVPAWSLPSHIPFPAALKQGAARTFKPVKVTGDDIAFLQYTGGTTGVSKGAVLLHSNVLSNVAQLALWVEDAYTLKPKPAHLTYICALPLYHIFALTVNALMGIQQGAHNILIPNPRDIPTFVKELRKYQFNILPGLNTLFNALLNNEDFRKLDFKPLMLTLGGGMAVQQAVAERWKTLTGCSITEGYGLSETSPVATANKCSAGEFTGTIGLPIPSTDIAIRDEDGKDLPFGEVGEICIRGPQVMAGYWNRPDETAKAMTRDGFFKTGDMGFMDKHGYTKIVDRKKDMILVSGFNVYPNELEDIVARHPGVLEVAAVGVPDEHSGEVPKLFVVRKDPNLTSEILLAYCKENLTGYKRPKLVEFRDELPKTNVGKILRRELRG